jgi:hypothetical protein
MDDDDATLAADRADFGVDIADHCQWPGCGETKHLKLGARPTNFSCFARATSKRCETENLS